MNDPTIRTIGARSKKIYRNTQQRLDAELQDCMVRFAVFSLGCEGANPAVLDKVAVRGRVRFHNTESKYFSNSRSYVSAVTVNPTWLEVCSIVNDMLLFTNNNFESAFHSLELIVSDGVITDYKIITDR